MVYILRYCFIFILFFRIRLPKVGRKTKLDVFFFAKDYSSHYTSTKLHCRLKLRFVIDFSFEIPLALYVRPICDKITNDSQLVADLWDVKKQNFIDKQQNKFLSNVCLY